MCPSENTTYDWFDLGCQTDVLTPEILSVSLTRFLEIKGHGGSGIPEIYLKRGSLQHKEFRKLLERRKAGYGRHQEKRMVMTGRRMGKFAPQATMQNMFEVSPQIMINPLEVADDVIHIADHVCSVDPLENMTFEQGIEIPILKKRKIVAIFKIRVDLITPNYLYNIKTSHNPLEGDLLLWNIAVLEMARVAYADCKLVRRGFQRVAISKTSLNDMYLSSEHVGRIVSPVGIQGEETTIAYGGREILNEFMNVLL